MNKGLILPLAVAGIGVIAFPPAQARDTFRSSPFHRCTMAALAVKPGRVVKAEQYTYEGRHTKSTSLATTVLVGN